MQLELRINNIEAVRLTPPNYDAELDNITSILSDVCRAISTNTEFMVSGFGQDKWPVDSYTDLPVFLEQLPEILEAVRASQSTEILFYEQGVERTISLSPRGSSYVALCVSGTDWVPNPAKEEIDREMLLGMLLAFKNEFLRAMQVVAPRHADHVWTVQWLEGTGM